MVNYSAINQVSSPDIFSHAGSTFLHIALKYGLLETAAALIEEEVGLTEKNQEGYSPLHLAVRYGQLAIVEALAEKGISLEEKDSEGNNALHIAIEYGHTTISEFLTKKVDLTVTDAEGNTPLHLAALYKQPALAKTLLKLASGTVQASNQDGNTPLHLAVKKGMLDIVAVFFQEGVSIDSKNHKGNTPLHFAVRYGYADIAEWLIDRTEKIDEKNIDGYTPLHFSAMYKRFDALSLLIENKAKINQKNIHGDTALHFAVMGRFLSGIRLLLTKGADLNILNKSGKKPLDYALLYAPPSIIALLIRAGGSLIASEVNGWTVYQNDYYYKIGMVLKINNPIEIQSCVKSWSFIRDALHWKYTLNYIEEFFGVGKLYGKLLFLMLYVRDIQANLPFKDLVTITEWLENSKENTDQPLCTILIEKLYEKEKFRLKEIDGATVGSPIIDQSLKGLVAVAKRVQLKLPQEIVSMVVEQLYFSLLGNMTEEKDFSAFHKIPLIPDQMKQLDQYRNEDWGYFTFTSSLRH